MHSVRSLVRALTDPCTPYVRVLQARDLLENLLATAPRDRYSAEGGLQHRWLAASTQRLAKSSAESSARERAAAAAAPQTPRGSIGGGGGGAMPHSMPQTTRGHATRLTAAPSLPSLHWPSGSVRGQQFSRTPSVPLLSELGSLQNAPGSPPGPRRLQTTQGRTVTSPPPPLYTPSSPDIARRVPTRAVPSPGVPSPSSLLHRCPAPSAASSSTLARGYQSPVTPSQQSRRASRWSKEQMVPPTTSRPMMPSPPSRPRQRLPSRLLPVSPSRTFGRPVTTTYPSSHVSEGHHIGHHRAGEGAVPETPSTTTALTSLAPPPLDGTPSDEWLRRRIDGQRQETQRAERMRQEIARLNSFMSG